jgi:hypothetical protein
MREFVDPGEHREVPLWMAIERLLISVTNRRPAEPPQPAALDLQQLGTISG